MTRQEIVERVASLTEDEIEQVSDDANWIDYLADDDARDSLNEKIVSLVWTVVGFKEGDDE